MREPTRSSTFKLKRKKFRKVFTGQQKKKKKKKN